jgi:hypothetical protein
MQFKGKTGLKPAKPAPKLAAWVEQRRKQQGVTRSDLCAKLGIDPGTYSRKLIKDGFNEDQLMDISLLLDFTVVCIPNEAKIGQTG